MRHAHIILHLKWARLVLKTNVVTWFYLKYVAISNTCSHGGHDATHDSAIPASWWWLCWSRVYGRSSPTAAHTSVEWPDEWAEAPNHQMKGALLLWENVLHANFIIAINYIIAGSRENDWLSQCSTRCIICAQKRMMQKSFAIANVQHCFVFFPSLRHTTFSSSACHCWNNF